MKTGYIVSYTTFDYNDDYYSSFENACSFDKKVYRVKADAEKKAFEANRTHADEVVGDVRSWTYNEGMSALLNECRDEEELYRRVFRKEPGKDYRDELEGLDNLTDGLPEGENFTDEDIDWFVENLPACRFAFVEEVEIEE